MAGARGTIDDDEHLAAYNAYLARLNHGARPPAPDASGRTRSGHGHRDLAATRAELPG